MRIHMRDKLLEILADPLASDAEKDDAVIELEIWIATQQISYDKLSHLSGVALAEVLSLIKTQRLDWYETYMELYPQSK